MATGPNGSLKVGFLHFKWIAENKTQQQIKKNI